MKWKTTLIWIYSWIYNNNTQEPYKSQEEKQLVSTDVIKPTWSPEGWRGQVWRAPPLFGFGSASSWVCAPHLPSLPETHHSSLLLTPAAHGWRKVGVLYLGKYRIKKKNHVINSFLQCMVHFNILNLMWLIYINKILYYFFYYLYSLELHKKKTDYDMWEHLMFFTHFK